ncbi:hypothetical protein GY45DRAFT_166530 [Cubamyces sp. BRFM 1775]|nr:hypothetical protein GY45DRAFT_166530 [Cubamyces sp. BRFM 1775]
MNKRRPIHRLPTEILGNIFQHTLPSNGVDLSDSYEEGPRMYSERRMRILITQVCGQWRTIAFGMAAFWNVIDMTTSQWSLACYERSKCAPLNVFAQYPLYNTVGTPLWTNGARIRELFIEIPFGHRSVVPTELPAILPPVPNLECLTLYTRSEHCSVDRPGIDSTPRPRVFPYPPLRLTKLILYNPCWIPGGIPLGQLTHLWISEGTEFQMQSLLIFLDQCTSLEKLILADVRIANIFAVPDNFSADLPRLQLLTLGVTHARYSFRCFLKRVILPPTVVVRMFDVDGGAFIDAAPHPSLPFTAEFDTIVIEQSHGGVTIQAGVWASTQSSTRAPGLFLQYQGQRYMSQHALTQHLLAPLVPLNQIQHVTIAGVCCDLAADLLQSMPRVAVLRIVEPKHESLRTALHHAMVRFPESTAVEIWTRRRRASVQLPLTKAKRTYYQIAAPEEEEGRGDSGILEPEDDNPVPRDQQECGRDGDGWEVVEVLKEPVVDLPGLRPARHPYDWW